MQATISSGFIRYEHKFKTEEEYRQLYTGDIQQVYQRDIPARMADFEEKLGEYEQQAGALKDRIEAEQTKTNGVRKFGRFWRNVGIISFAAFSAITIIPMFIFLGLVGSKADVADRIMDFINTGGTFKSFEEFRATRELGTLRDQMKYKQGMRNPLNTQITLIYNTVRSLHNEIKHPTPEEVEEAFRDLITDTIQPHLAKDKADYNQRLEALNAIFSLAD